MINDSLKMEIEVEVMKKYNFMPELIWSKLDKGFTNTKYQITTKSQKPLAICKVYSDTDIIPPVIRFEREKQALEIFGGDIAPEIIWLSDANNILVYEYVQGKEFLKMDLDQEKKELLEKTLIHIHDKARSTNSLVKQDVMDFYNRLIDEYENSPKKYPTNLIEDLKNITKKHGKILDSDEEDLTYIHGDLVPPNLLFQEKKLMLIDWEYFRPELPCFDSNYLNYYSKAHKISF
ncbi:MAG: phosphotransferase, partial [Candidatus Heimdallarchaeaceae archaeon]